MRPLLPLPRFASLAALLGGLALVVACTGGAQSPQAPVGGSQGAVNAAPHGLVAEAPSADDTRSATASDARAHGHPVAPAESASTPSIVAAADTADAKAPPKDTPPATSDAAKAAESAAKGGAVWKHPNQWFELHAPAGWTPVTKRTDRIHFILPPEALGETPHAGGPAPKDGKAKADGGKAKDGSDKAKDSSDKAKDGSDKAKEEDPLAGIDPKYLLSVAFAVFPKTEGQAAPSIAMVLTALADQKRQFGGYELLQSQPGRDLGPWKNHRVLARFRAKHDDPKAQATTPLIRLESRIFETDHGLIVFTLERPEAEIGRYVVPFETLLSGFKPLTPKPMR